jgi:hypothetical protein
MDDNLSAKQMNTVHGIPIEHLRVAKLLKCVGQKDNRWKFSIFKPWYDLNLPAVLEYIRSNKKDNSESSDWKARDNRAKALINEIRLRELEAKTLDKDKVIAVMKSISASQSIKLRNMAQELPHKLLGKDLTTMQVILTKNYEEICDLFQQPIADWTQQSKKDKPYGLANPNT